MTTEEKISLLEESLKDYELELKEVSALEMPTFLLEKQMRKLHIAFLEHRIKVLTKSINNLNKKL